MFESSVEELGEGLKVNDNELKAAIEKTRQDVHNTHMTGSHRSELDPSLWQPRSLRLRLRS